MQNRTLIAISLAVSLVAVTLTGCGSSTSTVTVPAATEAAVDTAPGRTAPETASVVSTIHDRAGDVQDDNYKRHPERTNLDIVRAMLRRDGDGLRLSITTAGPPRGKSIYALYYFDEPGEQGGIVEVRTTGTTAHTVASDADFSYSERLDDLTSIDGRTVTVTVPDEYVEPLDKWTVAVASRGEIPEISDDAPNLKRGQVGFSMTPFP
ncbi:hypothetical protein [Conexibacter woesei]|uniref:Lipoprotein n=1 Tax=Conexibacter woesei (strain DSM 14684 / CCUG 47730 / CIP 108061 / JCM 11494 / NBRC 100937 / ID131577) TaxID=469383 RepID=D3FAS6_CONWI|nr:hypothetical protein [Conexibacter woesei]ADB51239.1 hypothetical protein Cwoe_2820 [Conexibacter woesei DSM 14684]